MLKTVGPTDRGFTPIFTKLPYNHPRVTPSNPGNRYGLEIVTKQTTEQINKKQQQTNKKNIKAKKKHNRNK